MSDDEDEQMRPRARPRRSAPRRRPSCVRGSLGCAVSAALGLCEAGESASAGGGQCGGSFRAHQAGGDEVPPAPPASLETLCRGCISISSAFRPNRNRWKHSSNPPPESRIRHRALVDSLIASPRFGEKVGAALARLARYGDSAGYSTMTTCRCGCIATGHPCAECGHALRPVHHRANRRRTCFPRPPPSSASHGLSSRLHGHARRGSKRGRTPRPARVGSRQHRRHHLAATSLECALCHTHKFDPIRMRTYYKMYAYFNRTVPELSKEPGSHYFITGGVLEMTAERVEAGEGASVESRDGSRDYAHGFREGEFDGRALPTMRRIFTGSPPSARRSEPTTTSLSNSRARARSRSGRTSPSCVSSDAN